MSVLILIVSSAVKANANSHTVGGLRQTTRFNQNSNSDFSVYTKHAPKTIEVALRTEKKKISTTVCYVNYIHVPWIKQGSFV